MTRQNIYWTPVPIESLKQTKNFIQTQWNEKKVAKILTIFNKELEVAHKFELMELKKNLLKLRRM